MASGRLASLSHAIHEYSNWIAASLLVCRLRAARVIHQTRILRHLPKTGLICSGFLWFSIKGCVSLKLHFRPFLGVPTHFGSQGWVAVGFRTNGARLDGHGCLRGRDDGGAVLLVWRNA